MAFIDNPVIAALGNQLGLGGVFAAASGATDPTLATGEGPPTPIRPGTSKPNIPPYKERPYIPKAEGTLPRSGGVSPGGMNPITPGAMDPATLQDPNVQAMLGQYGVHPTTAPPDPNLFIHNPQAFQNHPVIAGLLEHGLEGLAYAHPGQNFLQSLIGGVQGMQEAGAARGQQVNAQTMAPILQAQQIASLQHMGDQHNESTAVQNYHDIMGQAAVQNAQNNAKNAQTRSERAAMIAPRKNTDGTSSVWSGDANEGQGGWVVDPTLGVDGELHAKNQYYTGAAHDVAVKKYNGDVSKLNGSDWLGIDANYQRTMSLSKGASNQLVHTQDNATRTTDAQIRAGASGGGDGKVSPVAKSQISEIDKDTANVNSTLKSISKLGAYTDENGKMVINGGDKAGGGAFSAYVGRLNARKQANATKRAAILAGHPAATATQIPDGADGMWDPVTKTTIYRSK